MIVLHYADGILFVAENRSQALHKVSEIYDRIGFAAVGRYNEFENLRTAGIRYADLRGYSYDRTDVTGRGLANAYAQLLGTIFSSGGEKPYEVEIIVAELGATAELDQIYRLTYDGSVADEDNFAVMGGSADVIAEVVGRASSPGLGLAEAVQLAVSALGSDGGPSAARRELGVDALEVAILDRDRALPRKFRRITRRAAGRAAARRGRDRRTGPRGGTPSSRQTASRAAAARTDGDSSQPDPEVTRRAARAVVIGTGLIGASIGCALTAAGYRVHLRDRKTSHARVAAGLGAGTIEPPAPAEVGLVMVAVPPRLDRRRGACTACRPTRRRRSPTSARSRPGCCMRCGRASVDLARYVGSHPMAGSQHSGPMTARAGPVRGPHLGGHAAPAFRCRPRSAEVQCLVRACRARARW